jgi:DNA-binding NarL/FixJ family response regulator
MPSSITLSEHPRVLLVDDNPAMIARASSVLSPGCEIVGSAKDGAAALEAIAALTPEVVVLDISMPGLTGFEVASRLKATGSTTAIVFLTVHEDEAVFRAAKAVGGLGYVVKSRLASDLEQAVIAASEGRAFSSAIRD